MANPRERHGLRRHVRCPGGGTRRDDDHMRFTARQVAGTPRTDRSHRVSRLDVVQVGVARSPAEPLASDSAWVGEPKKRAIRFGGPEPAGESLSIRVAGFREVRERCRVRLRVPAHPPLSRTPLIWRCARFRMRLHGFWRRALSPSPSTAETHVREAHQIPGRRHSRGAVRDGQAPQPGPPGRLAGRPQGQRLASAPARRLDPCPERAARTRMEAGARVASPVVSAAQDCRFVDPGLVIEWD